MAYSCIKLLVLATVLLLTPHAVKADDTGILPEIGGTEGPEQPIGVDVPDQDPRTPEGFSRFQLLTFDSECSHVNQKLQSCNDEAPDFSEARTWSLLGSSDCVSDSNGAAGVGGMVLIGNIPGLWHESTTTEWTRGGELEVLGDGKARISGILSASDDSVHRWDWQVDIRFFSYATFQTTSSVNWPYWSGCCIIESEISSNVHSKWHSFSTVVGEITSLQDGAVIAVRAAEVDNPVQIGCGASLVNPSFGILAHMRACIGEACEALLELRSDIRYRH